MIRVKKVYPIKGRKDFFKYVVLVDGKIHKGWSMNKPNMELYFDRKSEADRIANAVRKVRKLDKEFMSGKRTKK